MTFLCILTTSPAQLFFFYVGTSPEAVFFLTKDQAPGSAPSLPGGCLTQGLKGCLIEGPGAQSLGLSALGGLSSSLRTRNVTPNSVALGE